MNKYLLLGKINIILILLLNSALCYGVPKTKVLVPKNASEPVMISISGKSFSYYSVILDEILVYSVRGPGKLKIITRGQLNIKTENRLNYIIYYRINGGEKINVEFRSVKADNNAFFEDASLGYPGIGENIIIELSRGENSVEIWSGLADQNLYARALFTEIKEKKINWVSMSPLYPAEPVSLVTNEDVVTYFRYSSSNPLKVRVTGPTILRVLNRVEFDYKMKGKLNYRIEVKENNKLKNTYMLSTDRSDVTRYRRDSKKIPGKANEIVITVPSGTHTYEIFLLDKNSILARILFPKKDIKLESN